MYILSQEDFFCPKARCRGTCIYMYRPLSYIITYVPLARGEVLGLGLSGKGTRWGFGERELKLETTAVFMCVSQKEYA